MSPYNLGYPASECQDCYSGLSLSQQFDENQIPNHNVMDQEQDDHTCIPGKWPTEERMHEVESQLLQLGMQSVDEALSQQYW